MARNQIDNDRREERPSRAEFGGMPWCASGAEGFGSCGDMRKMMQASPCAGFLRRHRAAAYTALILVGLGFVILQAGWVLGIIAFFRTL